MTTFVAVPGTPPPRKPSLFTLIKKPATTSDGRDALGVECTRVDVSKLPNITEKVEVMGYNGYELYLRKCYIFALRPGYEGEDLSNLVDTVLK